MLQCCPQVMIEVFEPQHGWEPGRVTGGLAYTGKQRRDGGLCGIGGRGGESGKTLSNAGGCGRQEDGLSETQSALGLLPDGIPAVMGGTWPEVHNRVAQLKAAGNAIAPEVAAIFMRAILRIINEEHQ